MTLTIEVRAKPGKINELYQTLQALLPTMRQEMGCKSSRVSRDVEDGELSPLQRLGCAGKLRRLCAIRQRQRHARGHRPAWRVGEIQDRRR